MKPVIETYSGRLFDYSVPRPEQVNIDDISQALANVCRFGGHIKRHYSVAQHALLVRELVLEAGHPELGYAALHHDSHEAYVGDVPSPLKTVLGDEYRIITYRTDRVLAEVLGLDPREFHAAPVKEADVLAMRIEATVLKLNDGRTFADYCGFERLSAEAVKDRCPPYSPTQIRALFLEAHQRELAAR